MGLHALSCFFLRRSLGRWVSGFRDQARDQVVSVQVVTRSPANLCVTFLIVLLDTLSITHRRTLISFTPYPRWFTGIRTRSRSTPRRSARIRKSSSSVHIVHGSLPSMRLYNPPTRLSLMSRPSAGSVSNLSPQYVCTRDSCSNGNHRAAVDTGALWMFYLSHIRADAANDCIERT